MSTYDLNADEFNELKLDFITRAFDAIGASPSYGAMARAESIPDAIIHEFYDGIAFVPDDFWCNCN